MAKSMFEKIVSTFKYLLRIPENKSLEQKLAEEYDIMYQLSMLISDLETEQRAYSLDEMLESIRSPELMLSPKEYIEYAKEREWLIEKEQGWFLTPKGSAVIKEFLTTADL